MQENQSAGVYLVGAAVLLEVENTGLTIVGHLVVKKSNDWWHGNFPFYFSDKFVFSSHLSNATEFCIQETNLEYSSCY